MRRAAIATPRLDKLRELLLPLLERRGAASELAQLWSRGGTDKREQISVWFKKGKGRPTAVPTLLAVQFLVAQPGWPREEQWYIPTWDQLVELVIPLFAIRGKAADLTRFCDREPWDISRYFTLRVSRRREPDGEVALATLDWLTRWRIEHSLAESEANPLPSPKVWKALEQTFTLEREFRVKREQAEGRQLYLPGNDLFFQLIPREDPAE